MVIQPQASNPALSGPLSVDGNNDYMHAQTELAKLQATNPEKFADILAIANIESLDSADPKVQEKIASLYKLATAAGWFDGEDLSEEDVEQFRDLYEKYVSKAPISEYPDYMFMEWLDLLFGSEEEAGDYSVGTGISQDLDGGGEIAASGNRSDGGGHGGGGGSVGSGATGGGGGDGSSRIGKLTDDKGVHESGDGAYRQEGDTEIFTVSDAAKGGTNKDTGKPLDPRAEAFFSGHRFDSNSGTHKFNATYKVGQADDTTIFQVMNSQPNSGDRHQPQVFITMDKNGGIYQGHPGAGKKIGQVAPGQEFHLEAVSNGNSTQVRITQGSQVIGEMDIGHRRSGGVNTFRYGAYHHGSGQAQVAVTGATAQQV